MRKTIILGIIGIFMLVVTAWSASANNLLDDLTIYYELDDGAVWTDSQGYMDATCTNCPANNVSGKIGNGSQFDASNDVVNVTMTLFENTTDFSIALWVKYDGADNNNKWILGSDNANRIWLYDLDGGSDQKIYGMLGSGSPIPNSGTSSTSVGDDTWHHIVFWNNATDHTWGVKIDGGAENRTGSTAPGALNVTDPFCFGYKCADPSGLYFDGLMDEVGIWHKVLTHEDVVTLYNGSSGFGYDAFTASGADTLNITASKPETDTHFNTQSLAINFTVSSAGAFNCSLYFNDVLEDTQTGLAAGSSVLSQFNETFAADEESTFVYYAECNDGTTWENSTSKTFYVDNVQPDITWNSPLAANTTIHYLTNGTNLTTHINFSDPNLYSYYYNISQGGVFIYNESNTSLLGLTNLSITNSVNLSLYNGTLISTLKICDGHTDNDIDFKNVRKGDKELRFDGVKVYMEDKAGVVGYDFHRRQDRYNFDFKTNRAETKKSFIVSSDQYIDILNGRTEYLGHLVTGEKWIDFEMDGVKGVEVERLANNVVRVWVETWTPKDRWYFQSIGELNCVEEKVEFFVYDTAETYETQSLITEVVDFFLNVTPYNSSFFSELSANFNFNSTYYAPTGSASGDDYIFNVSIAMPLTSSDVNLSFFWNFTANGVNFTNPNQTMEVFVPQMDNCSTYSTVWANFTIRDEETDALTNGTIDYVFSYWFGSYSSELRGDTDDVDTNYAFCIYPAFANFTTNISIDYQDEIGSFTSRSFTNASAVVDNFTTNYTLYLLSNPTSITFHVTDDGDNDLENIEIRAYRYVSSTDSYTLVETQNTDPSGNAIFGLRQGTTEYRFEFYQDGVLRISTGKFKLFATSYEYVIRETEGHWLGERIALESVLVNLTYDNDTNIVLFEWSDVSNVTNDFCLNITGNSSTWYSACSGNESGSLQYTISTFNLTYTATALTILENGNRHLLDTLGIDTRDGWKRFGVDFGIIISILTFLTLSLIGLANKNAAVVGGCLAIVVLYFVGVIPVSLPVVMGLVFVGVIVLVVINRR